MCVLSWTYSFAFRRWVAAQYVLLLSDCHIVICCMSFALCRVLINCYVIFYYSFYVCFLVLCVCFLFCVFCVFVLFCVLFRPMYILVCFIFVYTFTDHCHRVKTQMRLINIILYHIISYIIHHIITQTFTVVKDAFSIDLLRPCVVSIIEVWGILCVCEYIRQGTVLKVMVVLLIRQGLQVLLVVSCY
jgi:hypothetical protein